MSHHCFRCNKALDLGPQPKVGRRDSCPRCGTDLHICKHCTFYDIKAYNDCRETSADRVVDKEKSNYCDYFSFRSGESGTTLKEEIEQKKKKLDDLFK